MGMGMPAVSLHGNLGFSSLPSYAPEMAEKLLRAGVPGTLRTERERTGGMAQRSFLSKVPFLHGFLQETHG